MLKKTRVFELLKGGYSSLQIVKQAILLLWESDPKITLLLILVTLVQSPLPVVSLYFSKKIVDLTSRCISDGATGDVKKIGVVLGWMIALKILEQVISRLSKIYEGVMRIKLNFHLQYRILNKANSLDLDFFETPEFYNKLKLAQQEAGFRPMSILFSILGVFKQFVIIGSLLGVLVTLSIWSVPIVLGVALPCLIIQMKLGKEQWSALRYRTSQQRKMGYIQNLLTSDIHAKEIRIYGLGDYLVFQWEKLFEQFNIQDKRLLIKQEVASGGTALITSITGIGYYSYVIIRTLSDPLITIGSLFMYTQAMNRAIGALRSLLNSIKSLYEDSLYMNNLEKFFNQKPKIKKNKTAIKTNLTREHLIKCESLNFSYPGVQKKALDSLSFEIYPGEKIAIVGENGSGKSTLVKLLTRLYDPQVGKITVDGIDLRDIDPVSWRQQVGVVFQDFARYAFSARENVGVGNIDYANDMCRIRKAAKLSSADKVIKNLQYGWDTNLGKIFDRSQDLSGGQWQTVALARAFLRESKILILDEPSAALDAKHEYELFKNFHKLAQDKTIIFISHRLSSVRMADRIFVMENGCMLESGNHDELITRDGKYAFLFNRQAKGYS